MLRGDVAQLAPARPFEPGGRPRGEAPGDAAEPCACRGRAPVPRWVAPYRSASSLPAFSNAEIAKSTSSTVRAAFMMVRILARSFATMG